MNLGWTARATAGSIIRSATAPLHLHTYITADKRSGQILGMSAQETRTDARRGFVAGLIGFQKVPKSALQPFILLGRNPRVAHTLLHLLGDFQNVLRGVFPHFNAGFLILLRSQQGG